ncbi:MAG: GTP cyclohydrolase I, partial [Chloroflexi bacterium]|nr:GTP cyclohydrolase I [Chloroflexota bacterium]
MLRTTQHTSTSNATISDLVRQLLALLGEDVTREGLADTPKRVEESLRFLTQGSTQDIDEVVNGAFYAAPTRKGAVVVKNIDFFSMCEHHLLPFFGRCHIAYIPTEKVIGLSKLPRIVETFSR